MLRRNKLITTTINNSCCNCRTLIVPTICYQPTQSQQYTKSYNNKRNPTIYTLNNRNLSSTTKQTNNNSSNKTTDNDISNIIGNVKASDPATWIDGKLNTNNDNTTTITTDTTTKATTAAKQHKPLERYNPALLDPLIVYKFDETTGEQIPVLKELPTKKPIKQRIQNYINQNKELCFNTSIISSILGGGTYYIYTNIAPWIVTYTCNILSNTSSNEISYITGIGSSIVIYSLYCISMYLTRIKPQKMYEHAIRYAANNTIVQQHLGQIKYDNINNIDSISINKIDTPNMTGNQNITTDTQSSQKTTTTTINNDDTTEITTTSDLTDKPTPSIQWYTCIYLPSTLRLLPEHHKVMYFGWERYWRPQTLITAFQLQSSNNNNTGIITAHVTHKLNGITDIRQMKLYVQDTNQTYTIIDVPIQRDDITLPSATKTAVQQVTNTNTDINTNTQTNKTV